MNSLFDHSAAPSSALPDPHFPFFARIALERGIERRHGANPAEPDESSADAATLTYRVPEAAAVGDRVEVPLGRGNTPTGGIITEIGDASLAQGLPVERVKPILRVTGAKLPPGLVELARWISSYYLCPFGMVMSAMLPSAVKNSIGLRSREFIDLPPTPPADQPLSPTLASAWEAIRALDAAIFPIPAPDLAARAGFSSTAPITRLCSKGLLVKIRKQVVLEFGTAARRLASAAPPPTLTEDQARIIAGIAPSLGSFAVHLIRGVTGSGKTEIYLRLIEQVLAAGKSALVLVPEISLTPQTTVRFQDRFAGVTSVAVLHSGLTASQRHKHWTLAGSGHARVVIGARSAIFAPLPNLGIVVVDEEHDGGYKQDQLPRYHGRDVAIKRAQLESCPIVMGTATPSLESWINATGPSARSKLWQLTSRIGAARLPKVEIIDPALDRAALGPEGATNRHALLSPTLRRALTEALGRGEQAILLINRRGFAQTIACSSPACGWSLRCGDCDATMVYHKSGTPVQGGFLRCHHCRAEQVRPTKCPVCGRSVIILGAGTQRVEEELETIPGLVRDATFARVDGDTISSGRQWVDLLRRFESGELKVMVGTQMIAKGLDFPNVSVVGVIEADTSLSLPDFRSAERTFQLVSQVAGRAGRGEIPGRVIVQTQNPNTPAIRFAAHHDYLSFAKYELACRARADLPPYSRMARIVIRHENLETAAAAGERIAHALRSGASTHEARERVRIDGPMPCPISRIAGEHRLAIEVLARTRAAIQSLLTAARSQGLLKSDAHTAIDVDPISLM